MNWSRRRFLLAGGALAASACAPAQSRPTDALPALYANPARNEWPAEFARLSADTQAMYRYAAANRDTLRWMPCTCGCVAGGHKDNFDCYVREVLPDGRVKLDTMSFG